MFLEYLRLDYSLLCTEEIVQAGLFLREFFLRDLILTRLVTLHHFSNLCDNLRFNAVWHTGLVVALVLCWGLVKVTSLLRYQSHVWNDYVSDIITRFT